MCAKIFKCVMTISFHCMVSRQKKGGGVSLIFFFGHICRFFFDFTQEQKKKKKEGGVRQTDKTDRNVEAKMRQIRLQDFAKMIDHPHVYLQ